MSDAPYRTNVPPAREGAPEPSRGPTAVAALIVGCTAMVALTAWWWVWVSEQFPIRVF